MPNTQKNKILLIEDDIYIRDVYEEVLKDAGYDVDVAADGEEGLVKVTKNTYSLVLLDIMTPRMTGIDFLKNLSKEDKEKTGAIVMLTNLAHDPVINEGINLGAKGYLIKSDIDPGVLVDKVKTFLA